MKFVKLLRLIKIVKGQKKIMSQMNSFMQIGIGMDRIMFFMAMFLMLSHITTCLWVICANFMDADENEDPETWLFKFYGNDKDNSANIYMVSLYWTITTITTVGYGDISGNNNLERIFAVMLMLIGVTCFSYLNGALSSIFQSMDSSNAMLEQRINLTNKVSK